MSEHGSSFMFKLVPNSTAKVGRSRGAAFKDGRGVSLHWDQEVSTTHGQFTLSGNQVAFTDVGSTNGTFIILDKDMKEKKLEKGEPYTLAEGTVLRLGSSRLKLTSVVDI